MDGFPNAHDDAPLPSQDDRIPLITISTLLIAAVLSAFVSIGAIAQLANLAWGLWFTEIFVFLAIPSIALQQAGRQMMRTTAASHFVVRDVAFGFFVGVLNFFAWAMPLMYAAQKLFPDELVSSYDSASIFRDQRPVELAILVMGVSVAAPVCEEVFFRGAVMRGFATRFSAIRSIAMTAIVFSAFHFDPIGFAARFEMGLLFGFLAWRMQSLWPAVAAHAANNITSTMLFFVTQGDSVEGDLPWSVPMWMWLLGNFALVVAFQLKKSRSVVTPLPDDYGSTRSLAAIVRPWLTAAIVAIVGLMVVDFRGVRLNFFDALHPIDRKLRTPELEHLRDQARAGAIDMVEYDALRERLSREHTRATQ